MKGALPERARVTSTAAARSVLKADAQQTACPTFNGSRAVVEQIAVQTELTAALVLMLMPGRSSPKGPSSLACTEIHVYACHATHPAYILAAASTAGTQGRASV